MEKEIKGRILEHTPHVFQSIAHDNITPNKGNKVTDDNTYGNHLL